MFRWVVWHQHPVPVPAGTLTRLPIPIGVPPVPAGRLSGHVAKGRGLPLVIVDSGGEGNHVRFEMRASSRIDGVPVAQHHGTF